MVSNRQPRANRLIEALVAGLIQKPSRLHLLGGADDLGLTRDLVSKYATNMGLTRFS